MKIETSAVFTFWKGKSNGEKQWMGVAFAIGPELTNQIEQLHGFCDRIMYFQVPLPCNHFMTVLSVYAPTLDSNEQSIVAFY